MEQLLDSRNTRGASGGTDAVMAHNDKLVALVAKYKGEAERLQFLKESAMNKAKLYEQTLEREKLRVTNLRQMNSSLEAELSRKRAQADSAVEKMEELEACWKGGAERKLEALTKEKADRESLYEGLAREAEKGQRQADIAAEQVAALASLKKGERLELETLRKNLSIMGSRSDDDAIIGKLTLELTNIKVAYQQLGGSMNSAAPTREGLRSNCSDWSSASMRRMRSCARLSRRPALAFLRQSARWRACKTKLQMAFTAAVASSNSSKPSAKG